LRFFYQPLFDLIRVVRVDDVVDELLSVFFGFLVSRYLHSFHPVGVAVQDRDERAAFLPQAFDRHAAFTDDHARELGIDVHEQIVGIAGRHFPVLLFGHVLRLGLILYVVGRIPVLFLVHFENGRRKEKNTW